MTGTGVVERKTVVLERIKEGRYEMEIPSALLETDGYALVQFASKLKKIVTDGRGPAIYVIRFGGD